jgi:hypothetical protein
MHQVKIRNVKLSLHSMKADTGVEVRLNSFLISCLGGNEWSV